HPHPSRSLSSHLSFFSSHGPHRHLPSFPTRRSSDLANLGFNRKHQQIVFAVQRAFYGLTSVRARIAVAQSSLDAARARTLVRPRSEEHTSELQSLTNLVCRLLLEKKKRTHLTRWTRE